MSRSGVIERHVRGLDEMCKHLGIPTDSYFDLHVRYGYQFDTLVFDVLKTDMSLREFVAAKQTSKDYSDDSVVLEMLALASH